MLVKKLLNEIGTPLIGYLIAGWLGVLISFLPDIFILDVVWRDRFFGKTRDRVKGIRKIGHAFTHSLWFPLIVGLVNFKAGLICFLHILIDYITHTPNFFFKGYKPLYPLPITICGLEGKKKVLLFSGGLDSTIAYFLLKPDILLYIKTGSRYEKVELRNLKKLEKKIGKKVKVIDMSWLGKFEQKNAHIPLRNLFFILTACLYGDVVYLISLKGETSKDKNEKFRKQTEKLVNYLLNDVMDLKRKKVKIIFPFRDWTKTEILGLYLNQGGDWELLKNYTISCYKGSKKPCGKCMACIRRWVAETLNGVEREYENDPYIHAKKFVKRWFRESFSPKNIFSLENWRAFFTNLPSNIELMKAIKKEEKRRKEKGRL